MIFSIYNTRVLLLSILLTTLLAWSATTVQAQIPRTINYQGALSLNNGDPVPDAQYRVSFRLYDAATSATELWSEQQAVVTFQGVFDAILGNVTPLNLAFDKPYWLGVTIEGQSEMTPRVPLVSVPFALSSVRAQQSDSANRASRAVFSDSASLAHHATTADTALVAYALAPDAQGVVLSLNGLQGKLTLVGEGGTTISTSGSTLKISSTGSNGISTISSNDGSVKITLSANGADLAIADSSITSAKIKNGSITTEKLAPGLLPTSLPPSGNAGGDLSGTYPNPNVRDAAITTPKLADKAVTGTKLEDITTAGTFGNASSVAQITVDSKGRVTSVQNVPISATNLTNAGGDLSGTYPNPTIAQKGAANGQVLKWNGTAWLPANDDGQVYNAGAGIAINGNTIRNTGDTDSTDDVTNSSNAGGDISGIFSNLKVEKIQNRAVSPTLPSNGQVLQFNATTNLWEPTTINTGSSGVAGGDLSGTYPNPTIAQKGATSGQVLSWNGSAWIPTTPTTSGTASGDLAGSYPNPTIAQKGAANNQVLKWNGTAWMPANDDGQNYTAGTGINITAGVVTNTGDTDPSNDITTSTSAGGDLAGNYPNPTIAQKSATTGQVLKWNGTSWAPANDNGDSYTAGDAINITAGAIGVNNGGITTAKLADGSVTTPKLADNAVTNVKITDATIQSTKLNQSGATTGQILKWNGTAWAPANDNGDSYTAGDAINITAGAISVNNAGITTAKLADGSVTTPKLADNAVTNVKITDATIQSTKLNQSGATTGQILKWNGTAWQPANDDGQNYTAGTGINIAAGVVSNTGDTDPSNDITTSTSAGGDLAGTYPAPTIAQKGATNNQVLKWNGTAWMPANDDGQNYTAGTGISIAAGVVTNTGDTDASNDITNSTTANGDLAGTYPNPTVDGLQGRAVAATAPTNGQVLKWNNTTNVWEPANDAGTNYTAGTGINIAAGVISNSGDTDASNDITTSTSAGGDLAGTYPAPTIAQKGATNGQVLAWNGTAWNPTTPTTSGAASGDLAGTYPAPTIAQKGATNNQVLKWNGTAWMPANDDGQNYTAGTGINIASGVVTNTGDTDASNDITNSTTANGDLAGTYPNPTVDGLQGRAVAATAPTNGQVLKWNNTTNVWEPANDAGTNYTAGTGISIAAGVVTNTGDTDASNDITTSTSAGGDLAGTYPAPTIAQKGATNNQVLKWNGTAWMPANDDGQNYTAGTGINIAAGVVTNTGDTDPSNDITNSTTANGDLAGTYPNPTVDGLQGRAVAATAPTNGQVLKWNNTTNVWEPANDAGTNYTAGTGINIAAGVISNSGDTDPSNDITTSTSAGGDLAGTYPAPTIAQKGATNNQVLKWNGTAWMPANDDGQNYTAGTGINIAAGVVTNTGDTDASNDITNSTTANGDLAGTYPNPTVDGLQGRAVAATAPTNGQVLKWNNTTNVWEPANDAGTNYTAGTGINIAAGVISNSGDTDASNDITTSTSAGGDLAGTYPAPTIAQKGATNNQVLKWNGTAWMPANDDGQNYTAGTGINIASGVVTNTGDTDASNDITNSTTANGDLAGTYPNPTVDGLQGRAVAATAPTNGQVLKWNNTTNVWEPANDAGTNYTAGTGINITAGVVTNTGDTDPSNDITTSTSAGGDLAGTYPAPTIAQKGATNNQVLKWNGTAWMPANDDGQNYTAGTGISIAAGVVTNTGDTDASNDITNSTTANGDLAGTYPNPTVDGLQGRAVAATAPTNGQVLKWNNTTNVWEPANDAGQNYTAGTGINIAAGVISNSGDTDPSNDITTSTSAGGDLAGTYPAPTIAQKGATSGQALVWNGTAWNPATISASGAAGGDLSGTYPNPNVVKLQNRTVASTAPTNGQVLKWNNGSSQWEPANDAGGGGDVTGPSSSVDNAIARYDGTTGKIIQNSAVVLDDTITVGSSKIATLKAEDGVTTSISLVLAPKGNGALLADKPDGAITGGNERGTNAVDLQMFRTNAAHVASGTRSVIVGGEENTASGGYALILGGDQNVASGLRAIVIGGLQNTASGDNSVVAGGATNTANGPLSFIGGGSNNLASSGSVVSGGTNNRAANTFNTIPGGSGMTLNGNRSFGINANNATDSAVISVSDIAYFGNMDMWLGNTNNSASELRFFEAQAADGNFPAAGTNYTALKAGTQTADITWTLPGTTPTVNQVLTASAVSGNNVTLGWSAASGGDVTGPASSLDNAITRFDGTTGKLIQNSSIIIDDTVTVSGNKIATLRADDGSSANMHLVLEPKGTGALVADKPSGTSAGGNIRGLYANDFQRFRASATMVASGDAAVLMGGSHNTASGQSSVVAGGGSNTASALYSGVLSGFENTASSSLSTVIGGRGLTLSSGHSVGFNANPIGGTDSAIISISNVAYFGNVNMWLGNTNGSASELRFYESQAADGAFPAVGTNYTAFKAGTQTADITWTLPTTTPTANQVLTATGVSGNNVTLGWSSSSGAVSNLIGFTASQDSSAPLNNTRYISILQASGTATSIDIALSPKGNGALTAEVADGSAPNGNKRGILAVDWQTSRTSATQIASGDRSVIGGGHANTVSGIYSTIAGGYAHLITGAYSAVGGGITDSIQANHSFIGAGENNKIPNTADWAFIGAGAGNTASNSYSVIAGGLNNTSSNQHTFVGGGNANTASNNAAVVVGGVSNRASGAASFIGGGNNNLASASNAIVVAGSADTASGSFSTIVGGQFNKATGTHSFIGGGATNSASANYTVVAGGSADTASALYATVGGGNANKASQNSATVAGGSLNKATGIISFIGGGSNNTVSGYSSAVGGGYTNTVSGDTSAIAGGISNTISGDGSFIGGGTGNSITSDRSTIGGGANNSIASGNYATIAGGNRNSVTTIYSTIGGGSFNYIANGIWNTIAGGVKDTIQGAGATYSAIAGGTENAINISGTGASSFIASGWQNKLSGRYSTILGGSILTLSGDFSNAYYGNDNSGRPMSVSADSITLFANTNMWLGGNDNKAKELRFYEAQNTTGAFPAAGTNYTAFKAGAQSADVTYTLPTAAPTSNGQVLSSTTAGVMSWVNASSGSVSNLIGFTASQDSTAPMNNTRYVSILQANGTATDIDIALTPKGAGALTAQKADNAVAGGNKRGYYAVDWQISRSTANQVAKGDFSSILSGAGNRADTSHAVVVGGLNNLNMGLYSTITNGNANAVESGVQFDFIANGSTNAIYKPINPSVYSWSASPSVLPNNYSTILNGSVNQIRSYGSLIGSGLGNKIYSDYYGVILTGTSSLITGLYDVFIGIGQGDTVKSSYTFVGSGFSQKIDTLANYSFIGAGSTMSIGNSSGYSFIGSGGTLSIGNSSPYSFIGAGGTHSIKKTSPYSFIGSGYNHTIDTTAEGAVIVGGYQNTIARTKNSGVTQNWNYSGIVTGYANKINGWLNFIGAGWTDTISTIGYSTILSGNLNKIDAVSDQYDYIGNGYNNKITNASYSNILNGYNHVITVDYSTIGSGYNDTIVGQHSIILAGHENYLSMSGGFIASGASNKGRAFNATILNGNSNTIDSLSHFSIIGNGQGNNIDNDVSHSVIIDGYVNTISTNGIPYTSGSENTNDFNFIGTGYANYLKGIYSIIGSGQSNVMDSVGYSMIGTGYANRIKFQTGGSFAHYSMIGAGELNLLQGHYGFMGAGYADTVIGDYNTIVNSRFSKISGVVYSGIVSGFDHTISGDYSFIGGGYRNSVSGDSSSVGGGSSNIITGMSGFIGGGYSNSITNSLGVIGGGDRNFVSGWGATVAGGTSDSATASAATIGGGLNNKASGANSTIGGGLSNTATASYSSVLGGLSNDATGSTATVAGGNSNLASGSSSAVGGGFSNEATASYATVVGGDNNTASASYSTVLGGSDNTANAQYNLVFGEGVVPTVTETHRVYLFDATNWGKMAFNRENAAATDVWTIGTAGGNGNGARLTTGGTWTNASSRTLKDRFVTLDSSLVLHNVRNLELGGWHYKGLNEYHIGPFAEDFYSAFGTGTPDNPENNKTLAALDVAGVALYSSQQLIKQNEAQETRIKELESKNALLEERLNRLELQNTVSAPATEPASRISQNIVRIVSIVPDPASSTVVVKFALDIEGAVTLNVVTSSGELRTTALDNVRMNKGSYEVEISVQDFSSGWYIANLRVDSNAAQRLFRVIH